MSTIVSTISETSNLLLSSHASYQIFRWLRIQMAYIDLDQKIQRQLIQFQSASRGDSAQRYQTGAAPDMAHRLYDSSALKTAYGGKRN